MSKKEKKKIILVIICISFLQGLQFGPSPVLGRIAEHFQDADVSLIQMLITGPSMVSVFVALASGWLVLKISKKKLLLFASLTAAVTGFIPFLADSFWLLFASRLAYGITLGLATTLNTAVVADFFEGEERVSVMGIQAASIGAGLVCVTTLGGWLGAGDFRNSYWVNVVGIITLVLIWLCLPEVKPAGAGSTGRIRLPGKVYITSAFAFLEFFFLITFTTNIAMHLSGSLAGNSAVSGSLTGIFSGIQIVAGLVLGKVTRITGRYTMPVAMLSFSAGALLLILFPSNLLMLAAGALFCGFSQGIFIPTGMVMISNAVAPIAAAMASAVFTSAMSMGQFLSPAVLNSLSGAVFDEVTTSNVYRIAAVGMAAAAVLAVIWRKKDDKERKDNYEKKACSMYADS